MAIHVSTDFSVKVKLSPKCNLGFFVNHFMWINHIKWWTAAVCQRVCQLSHSFCNYYCAFGPFILHMLVNKADCDWKGSWRNDYRQCFVDVATKKLQIAKWRHFTHYFKISATNSASDKMWNIVSVFPSVPELWSWIIARQVVLQKIMMSVKWTLG